MKTREEFIDALRPVLSEAPRLRLALLFGSTARGTDRTGSDLDVTILPVEPGLSLADELALQSRLALAAKREVDLVRLGQCTPALRYRMGLTDFAVDYSSPAVKGRKIWGELEPTIVHGTGPNAATKLTASGDFVFAGKPVPAGSYALYTILGKASWTVVLSSSTDAWGNDGFDSKKDLLRVATKPEASAPRERLTFLFRNTSDKAEGLDLEWEKLRLPIPLQVDNIVTASETRGCT